MNAQFLPLMITVILVVFPDMPAFQQQQSVDICSNRTRTKRKGAGMYWPLSHYNHTLVCSCGINAGQSVILVETNSYFQRVAGYIG